MTLPPALLLFAAPDHWLWALAGLGAGLYWFYRGFSLLQRRRAILNIPAPKIRNASLGLVELSGQAVGPYTMQSPLNGAACYYYRSIAWRLKQSGKNPRWEKVADESLHIPFYLDDKSGRVLVDPNGAELDLPRDFQREFHTSLLSSQKEIPTNIASFLVRHGLDTVQRLKLEEYCIKPKNAMFILGTLAPNPGVKVRATPESTIADDPIKFTFNLGEPAILSTSAEATALEATALEATVAEAATMGASENDVDLAAAPEIVRLRGSDAPSSSTHMTQQEKVAAALLRAGIVNPAAWTAAPVDAVAEIVNPRAEAVPTIRPSSAAATATATTTATATATALAKEPEFDLNPKTVVMKGDRETAYFISWRSQRALVQSLGWKSTLMIWGGPALSLVALLFLLQHFGVI